MCFHFTGLVVQERQSDRLQRRQQIQQGERRRVGDQDRKSVQGGGGPLQLLGQESGMMKNSVCQFLCQL